VNSNCPERSYNGMVHKGLYLSKPCPKECTSPMNTELRRRTDEVTSRLAQLRDSL
jgi:hypothetical protein